MLAKDADCSRLLSARSERDDDTATDDSRAHAKSGEQERVLAVVFVDVPIVSGRRGLRATLHAQVVDHPQLCVLDGQTIARPSDALLQ